MLLDLGLLSSWKAVYHIDMKVTIEIPEYNGETGLVHDGHGGKLRVYGAADGNHARIDGDRDGMITLANALLSIAYNWDQAPEFAHHHLDPNFLLDDGSTEVVVQRLKS